MVQIIECPRDAMQGWPHFIATPQKVQYLNALLQVGFDTLDCGSFVSHKAIPQMADTAAVLPQLRLTGTTTKRLVIVANLRGAEEAVTYEMIDCLGFPFSISPTFQQRNANSSIEEAYTKLDAIANLCAQYNKTPVVYISMGFGNPYGDAYDESLVLEWVEKISQLNIPVISLADTVGLATPGQVLSVTRQVITTHPAITVGVHLHSAPLNRIEKLAAAFSAGCRRFDGALNGIGGCPMANDELVGNMDTQQMIGYFNGKGLATGINEMKLAEASAMANSIFITHD